MKFHFKNSVLALACAAVVGASLFSSAAQAALSRKPQDNLFVAVSTEPVGLDPAMVDDNYSGDVISNIYESLLAFKPGSMEVEPGLAESWTISDDGLEYTFKLRQGVKFHDGTPFDAEAVKFNIERQMPENRTARMAYAELVYGDVAKVEVLDQYSVKITLKQSSTPFLRNMAMLYAAPIASPTALKANNNNLMTNPVGTGPYRLVAWDRGQQVILTTFEDYWGEKPKVQNVIFRLMKENGARVVALNNGEVDIITGIDANVAPQITAAGNKIFQRDGNSTLYMLFNTREHEQTKDREIRRALAQAINTPELVKSLYKGFSSYANTYFPSFMAGYSENTPTVTYDPEAAKKALAEKGVTKVKIIANSNASYSNTVGGQVLSEAVQAYLKEVGVEASIAVYDWATFKSRLMTDSWDLSFIGWNGDNGDPDNFINIFARPDANINQGLWQNEEFNALIEQGVHVKDGPERTKIYEEAERVLAEDVGIFPIAHAQNLLAYRPNIKNAEVHPIGLMFFKDVEKTVE